MNITDFNKATQGTGARYSKTIELPRYELVGITVVYGDEYNNFIKVVVKDAAGNEQFGAWVRHSFGSEHERFPGPAQFNLGPGSHFNDGDDPPNRITVEGLPSDVVKVGNSSLIGFTHTQWSMTFRRVDAAQPPPEPEPEPEPTPIGNALTRQRLARALRTAADDLEKEN